MLPVIEEKLNAGKTVSFTPFGDSMKPLLYSGRDSVTVQKFDNYKKYDICLFLKKDGSLTLHRIIDAKNGYVAMGDNTYRKETDITILGKVIFLERKGKNINMSSPLYKAYVVIWTKLYFLRYFIFRAKRKITNIFRKEK